MTMVMVTYPCYVKTLKKLLNDFWIEDMDPTKDVQMMILS